MSEQNQEESAELAPAISKKSNMTEADKKWGKKVMDYGFCIIPSILLQAQRRLNLNSTQLTVLLQIADHWWHADAKPFPGKAEIAFRLDITERQVQRIIADLEKAGLVKREERHSKNRGRLSNYYNLDGLAKKLKEFEPEFREAKEQARKAQKAAASRGWRPSRITAADAAGAN